LRTVRPSLRRTAPASLPGFLGRSPVPPAERGTLGNLRAACEEFQEKGAGLPGEPPQACQPVRPVQPPFVRRTAGVSRLVQHPPPGLRRPFAMMAPDSSRDRDLIR